MDKNTLAFLGEIVASVSAWYAYESARLGEPLQAIDGARRGQIDREIERESKDAKEHDMITYPDGSFRVRNEKTGLLEYRRKCKEVFHRAIR